MLKKSYLLALIFLTFSASFALAAVWTDEFNGDELEEGWTFQDRPGDPTTIEVIDGQLRMTHVPDGFGHLLAERPVLFRDGPEGDFSIYGLFNSDPEEDYGAWIGIFIGDPFTDDGGASYAFLGFGGEAGAIILIYLGAGKPAAPSPLPFWMKLEKSGNQYTAYIREKEGDDWQNVGNLVRDIEDPVIGIGMLNHWDAITLTLIVDSFHIEGEKSNHRRRLARLVNSPLLGGNSRLSKSSGKVGLSYQLSTTNQLILVILNEVQQSEKSRIVSFRMTLIALFKIFYK